MRCGRSCEISLRCSLLDRRGGPLCRHRYTTSWETYETTADFRIYEWGPWSASISGGGMVRVLWAYHTTARAPPIADPSSTVTQRIELLLYAVDAFRDSCLGYDSRFLCPHRGYDIFAFGSAVSPYGCCRSPYGAAPTKSIKNYQSDVIFKK